MNVPQIRLTSLAHGGGCGCKLAPSVLQQLLSSAPVHNPYKQLLVGIETGDDAAVWQVDDNSSHPSELPVNLKRITVSSTIARGFGGAMKAQSTLTVLKARGF